MLTTGRMDVLICGIYIVRKTPGGEGGAKRLDQGDFGCDPSVLLKGTVPLCLFAAPSET